MHLARRTIKVLEELRGPAHLRALVTAAKLGPGLFENLNPDLVLVAFALAECKLLAARLAVGHREVIVDDDDAWLAVNDELDRVTAGIVHLLGEEVVANTAALLFFVELVGVSLGQAAKRSESVAIIARTHDDVRRVNSVEDVEPLALEVLGCASPVDLLSPELFHLVVAHRPFMVYE